MKTAFSHVMRDERGYVYSSSFPIYTEFTEIRKKGILYNTLRKNKYAHKVGTKSSTQKDGA